MIDIIQASSVKYLPRAVLTYYKSDSEEHVSGVPESYLELRYIRWEKDKPMLLQANPVTSEFIEMLSEEVDGLSFEVGRLPENVLYYNNRLGVRFIWYNEPMERDIYYDSKSKGTLKLPYTIYSLSGKTLRVYFAKDLDDDSKVFVCKLPNFYGNGSFCTGNITIPRQNLTPIELKKAWERVVWLSNFTHLANHNSMKKFFSYLNKDKIQWKLMTDQKMKVKELFIS